MSLMEAFGVRFLVCAPSYFQQLRSLFYEIKRDKDGQCFRNPEEWLRLVPDDVKTAFYLPTKEERADWLNLRPIIAIPHPSEQLGACWDFYRLFEAIEESEYSLISCEMVEANVAEMQIDPWGYPYGRVGPLIALAEAFGFIVLGVNECGHFENLEDLYDQQ